jgi:hypothetical protein
MLIPDLSAGRAYRHIAFLLSVAALAIPGCEREEQGGTTYGPGETPYQVEVTIGAEAFEPPVAHVPADRRVELTLFNETAREQTVVVEGVDPFTVPAHGAGGADLGARAVGRYRIRLAGTPFEATLVAEDGDEF